MQPLVSIITCCYNGVRFVNRWAESLLEQTYGSVEILFVDDGSTDGSGEMGKGFKNAFEEKGYIFRFFRQDNQGIGGATNVGLLNMNGNYFMIYDIDDILYPNSIAARVKYLEENMDCSLVLSNGHYVLENDIQKKYPIEFYSANITNMLDKKEWIFEDIILGRRVCDTCPYMHRTSSYLAVNPQRTIYPTKYQQDTQITMISSYRGLCGYIDEKLYAKVSHDDSHSHAMKQDKSIDEMLAYRRSTKEAKCATIDILPIDATRKQKYKRTVENSYMKGVNNLFAMEKNKEREHDVLPKSIIVFGGGAVGLKILAIARKLAIDIECFFDNNPVKIGSRIENVEVKSIADCSREFIREKYIVIASRLKQDDIQRQLEKMDLKCGIDFCSYLDFLSLCREELFERLELVDSVL